LATLSCEWTDIHFETYQARFSQGIALPKILNVEPCNYLDQPRGGQLEFCKMLVRQNIVGDLVGSFSDIPCGHWITSNFANQERKLFSLYRPIQARKPRIPLRVRNLISILRYSAKIRNGDSDFIFVHAPEVLIALYLSRFSGMGKVIYFAHGARNPLEMPRYKWGIALSKPFAILFKQALQRCRLVLIAASKNEVDSFADDNAIADRSLQFPMRFNDAAFAPREGQASSITSIAVLGRLNRVKGWDFLLDVFANLRELIPDRQIKLTFIGDGEDREALIARAKELKVFEDIEITGFIDQNGVSQKLSEADLVLSGSTHEGWPISILEALACARNVVSTDVSGSRELISDGRNGYVVGQRDALVFAKYAAQALSDLPRHNMISTSAAEPYRESRLRSQLLDLLQEHQ
jgi:glycosyltransferase involved in cell wall biosynthesis